MPEPSAVDLFTEQTVEAALATQRPLAVRHVRAQLRGGRETDEILKKLRRRLRAELAKQGVVAGAKAALPETQIATLRLAQPRQKIVEATVFYILAAAESHGIPVEEMDDPRDLLWPVIFTHDISSATDKIAQRTGKHWSAKLLKHVPPEALTHLNTAFGPNTFTKHASKDGLVVIAHVLDGSMGSVIGFMTSSGLAQAIVLSSHAKIVSISRDFLAEGATAEPEFVEKAEDPTDNEATGT